MARMGRRDILGLNGIAMLVIGEPLTWATVLGGTTILAGVWMVNNG